MIKEQLKQLPRTSQEDIYGQFYSAYLSALENNNEELERRYQTFLRELVELWQFSVADRSALESEVSSRRGNIKEFINLFVEPAEKFHLH
jgi:hypothetical protein